MTRDRIVDRLCEVSVFLDGLYRPEAGRWPSEVDMGGERSESGVGTVTLIRIHTSSALCAIGQDNLYLADVHTEHAERYTALFARAMAARKASA